MKKAILFVALCCSMTVFAQSFDYQLILMDSRYDKNQNQEMVDYLNGVRPLVMGKMQEKIGFCEKELRTYGPQSELSNLLTDVLYQYGMEYSKKEDGTPVDLSILNFGGIRTSLKQGDITVGGVFEISPFDNTLVVIALKGSELKKVFDKFNTKYSEPYSHAKVTYKDGKVASVLVNGSPIDDNRVYRLVTIDFIQTGGDNILSGCVFEKVIPTGLIERDVFIDYISKAGKPITGELDDRVVVE